MFLSHPPSTTVPVPLAHPTSITTTANYDEPCVAFAVAVAVAVAFALSRPGELFSGSAGAYFEGV